MILLDVQLPTMDGYAVARALRQIEALRSTPIIAVTSSPEALRAEGCQADAVLTKPCQADTLIAAARLFVRHLSGLDSRS